jgi:hypothetical protein
MKSKFTRRDYDAARMKLAGAKLTARQLDALEDLILSDAVVKAENAACVTKGKRTHWLSGLGSLVEYHGKDSGAYEAIKTAVFWYHEKAGQRLPVAKDRQYDDWGTASTWRPEPSKGA